MSDIIRREVVRILSWYCFICNYFEEKGRGTLCGQKPAKIVNGKIVEYDECVFCSNSRSIAGARSKVGLKQSVFLPLGLTIKQCQNWGPHQLLMYLQYPEMNWQPPPIPNEDNYGFPVDKEKARQTIHHINNRHYDNRKDNISWNLTSDHTRNGQSNTKLRNFIIEDAKKCAKALGMKIPKKKMDRR